MGLSDETRDWIKKTQEVRHHPAVKIQFDEDYVWTNTGDPLYLGFGTYLDLCLHDQLRNECARISLLFRGYEARVEKLKCRGIKLSIDGIDITAGDLAARVGLTFQWKDEKEGKNVLSLIRAESYGEYKNNEAFGFASLLGSINSVRRLIGRLEEVYYNKLDMDCGKYTSIIDMMVKQ